MKKSWSFTDVNGQEHSIVYKTGFGGMKLIVDGTKHKLKSQNWFVNVIDYYVRIAGTGINLVAIGNKVDVAIDGVFIGSGEQYVPVQANTPAWVWVLVGLSSVIGFVLNGVLGILVAVAFATLYINFALAKQTGKVIAAFVGWIIVQTVMFLLVNYIYLGLW